MPMMFENEGPSRAEVATHLATFHTQAAQIAGISAWLDSGYPDTSIKGVPIKELILSDLPSYSEYIKQP